MFNTVIVMICIIIFIGMIWLDIYVMKISSGKSGKSGEPDNDADKNTDGGEDKKSR